MAMTIVQIPINHRFVLFNHSIHIFFLLLLFVYEGPAINPIMNDSEEPLPSLSDWHDYEPNLEFDDTELTHPPTTNGKITFRSLSMALLFSHCV